jgi:hypothetical protein
MPDTSPTPSERSPIPGSFPTGTYQIPYYCDREIFGTQDGVWGWTAQDYTLCHALRVDDNYAAEQIVADAVVKADSNLSLRVTFDSEYGCFFAHTHNQEDMIALVSIIAGLVAATGDRSRQPGPITQSPSYLATLRNIGKPQTRTQQVNITQRRRQP